MSAVAIIPASAETADAYHRSGAWGSTLISTFLRSPRLADAIRRGVYVPEPTPAQRFGQLFHARMDPGSDFDARYACGPCHDRRTKAWKEAEAASSRTLLTPDTWDALHGMAESVRANPFAACLIDGAEHEVGFRTVADEGPFQIQCRADLLNRWEYIADFKSTANLDAFAASVVDHGYHRQAALYRRIIARACGKTLPFSFIVVENEPPFYRSRVIDLTPDFLAIGEAEIDAALVEIARRTKRSDWRDGGEALTIEPPAWLSRRLAA